MPALPNLFIIGAMKSGTTSLWHYLGEHPQIFAPKKKEIKYFSHHNDWRRHMRKYLAHFSGATNERFLLDGSPHYTMRPQYEGMAQRIYEFNPSSRFIYILRDPLSRLLSHYRYFVWTGRESRLLREAVSENPIYLDTSHYAHQLRPYLERFGSSSVYVLTYESMARDARLACRSIFTWLGVDPDFVPASIERNVLPTPPRATRLDPESLRVKIWRKFWPYREAIALLPRSSRRFVRSLLPILGRIDAASPEYLAQCEYVREEFGPRLKKWVYELEDLLRCRFEEWPTRV